MLNLAGKEKQALLNADRKIQTYKFIQTKDSRKLIKKAIDKETKPLLIEISASELSDAKS